MSLGATESSILDDIPIGDGSYVSLKDGLNDVSKVFVRQVLMVIHTCHSHNISASVKRLGVAHRLFKSVCEYDSLYDTLITEVITEISSELSRLRDISPDDESEISLIKKGCLSHVRRLHEVTTRTKVREGSDTASSDDLRVYAG